MPTNTPELPKLKPMEVDTWYRVPSHSRRAEGELYIENPDGDAVDILTKSRDTDDQSGNTELSTTDLVYHSAFKVPALVRYEVSVGTGDNVKVWVNP